MSNTTVQNRRKEAQELKQRVCDLLNWDELAYAEYQYKAGLLYLQHYIPNDPSGIDMLASNKVYWSWWKNRWADRDKQFCNPGTPMLCLSTRLKMYHLLHNPEYLAKEIWPNGVVLNDSYAKMIGDVIDDHKKERV